MAYRLIEGIRILDMAGPEGSFCSQLLADMGADVVKVERPGGDPSRFIGPSFPDARSPFFSYHNRNKRGITLNIEDPQGRDLFLRFIKETDVVVESFPPEHLRSLRLGFEILQEKNPGLILASITGFGQTGPRSQFRSCDLVASAMGGQMHVCGSPSAPPLKLYGEQSFYAASLFAATGILLALRRRTKSGKGTRLDISMQEAVASTLEHVWIRYFYERTIAQRRGGIYWNDAFCVLPCRDGHILLTPLQQWETLVEWMAGDGMAGDLQGEEWKDREYRRRHLDHLLEILREWTLTYSVGELFAVGQLMRFPWAPVLSPAEVLTSPQLKSRNFFTAMDVPGSAQPVLFPGAPYRCSSSPASAMRPAPKPGEQNDEIYAELGLSAEEIRSLAAQKII